MSGGRSEDAGGARHDARRLDPGEVMVYLNVLDRFETPSYERAWRYFRETAEVCPDYASFQARCPLWSETYSQIDRVLCTYETAALLIRHGGLNEDLFFEQIPRVIDVWASARAWVEGLRQDYRPGLFGSVEWLAMRMEEWEGGPARRPGWRRQPLVPPLVRNLAIAATDPRRLLTGLTRARHHEPARARTRGLIRRWASSRSNGTRAAARSIGRL